MSYERPLFGLRLKDLRTRAEAGEAAAQYELGKRMMDGDGIPKDESQAVTTWFINAAKQDHLDACFKLGVAYGDGKGVPVDKTASYSGRDEPGCRRRI
ncbi:hypothetical protein DFJ74DRAFT_680956 [Hyaloraphidium curvatum]|nr:hypothetical protein DFJ74DRAFT_680956 [Hyaloraphidium curvatum]